MTLKAKKPVNNGYFHFRHFFTSELLSEISKMSDEFGIVVAFDMSCVALLTIYFGEVRDFKKRNGLKSVKKLGSNATLSPWARDQSIFGG